MEDLKAYMESGVLELYVLGDLSQEEQQEVERMAVKYPEVREELTAIEIAIESYAGSLAVEPGEQLRNKVLSSLSYEDEAKEDHEAKVISMRRPSSFYKYAFAACLALLLVSWSSLFVVYNRLQESRSAMVALQHSNQQFATNASFMQQQLSGQEEIISVFTNSDFKVINLKGTPNAPEARMKVAFNPKSEEVMIDLSTLDMPVNDTAHQYQLWALVDNKPVDLGVFDKSAGTTGMKKMKAIGRLQTFAVTLEPRGGSVNPTLTQLMVAGNI